MDFALFSPSSLFPDSDDDSTDDKTTDCSQGYVEREHQFPGMVLHIREFAFHELNANLLWPGTFSFAEWLVEHSSWIKGRRIIELGRIGSESHSSAFHAFRELWSFGDEISYRMTVTSGHGERARQCVTPMDYFSSGTGALAIFLKKSFHLDITTSDYNDQEIEENIAHNCRVNGVSPVLPHIKRKFLGDTFPSSTPDWDLVIASDILLYVKQYDNLIKTLSFLLKSHKLKVTDESSSKKNGEDSELLCSPAFIMSWRRRIGKEEESLFFNGCEKAGLQVVHMGARVYCIKPKESHIPRGTI